MNAQQTRREYDRLNKALLGLADEIAQTVKRLAPHLAQMQSLLSQRGSDRKKVLKDAGLPSWTQYAREYADKLDCSMRTIQREITTLRNGGKKPESKSKPMPRLDRRQQAHLVKASLAAKRVVDAVKNGGNVQQAIAKYEKAAPTSATVESLSDLITEPDWKAILAGLIAELETTKLPTAIAIRVKEIRAMFGTTNLRVLPNTFDCTGCKDMHKGIADLAMANPKWTDERLAKETATSGIIVRQARARYLAWRAA